jgi:hypothetical protein
MVIEELEREMRDHSSGCAEKYLKPKDRLCGELERSRRKAEARLLRPIDGSAVIERHADDRPPLLGKDFCQFVGENSLSGRCPSVDRHPDRVIETEAGKPNSQLV